MHTIHAVEAFGFFRRFCALSCVVVDEWVVAGGVRMVPAMGSRFKIHRTLCRVTSEILPACLKLKQSEPPFIMHNYLAQIAQLHNSYLTGLFLRHLTLQHQVNPGSNSV